jgi:hypothetical protein
LFPDAAALEQALERLVDRELVVRLLRRPGQKEERYAHRLGEDADDAPAAAEPAAAVPAAAPAAGEDRLARLEREVAELRAEVAALRERD